VVSEKSPDSAAVPGVDGRDGETGQIPRARAGLSKDMLDQFVKQGYLPPIRVLSPRECRSFLRAVNNPRNPPPLDWYKGHAASSRAFYKIATYPAIIDVVAALLGEDVMLWGASIVNRPPDAVHAWHTDIESANPSGRTVSVWIGIEGTARDSSLLVIPYSHRFGTTVQEAEYRLGKGRDDTTHEDIIRCARERDARSQLVWLEMTDGEGLFFDGRLWHSSHNVSRKTRQALLLQYATPGTIIRIPDPNHLDWPFRQLNVPKPPCLMVRGNDTTGVNRIVPAPVAANAGWSPQLTSQVYPLRIPLPREIDVGWKPYPIFSGSTADLRSLSCHASILTSGQCPHPPHRHKEEELLLLLAGEVDLILADQAGGERRKRLRSGQFVYYPAYFAHTLETVSDEPANYLMFRWFTDKTQTGSPLPFGQFTVSEFTEGSAVQEGLRTRQVFAGPTDYLRTLHCHASTLPPGAGYEPHTDAYDVAILVLEGEFETLGERVTPNNVVFYAAGEPHGLRNVGDRLGRYLVFEFHGSRAALADALLNPRAPLLVRVTDPRRWGRRLKALLRRFIKR
jgi:quercetin dioxygenase-like cupin family protein